MADNKSSIIDTITQTVASHPHATGISMAAIAAAVSHWYYNNALLTTAAAAVIGLLTGEVIAGILARAKDIQAAASAGRDIASNIAMAGMAAETAARRLDALEKALAEANAKLDRMAAKAA
jgi:hypothetical protein